MAAGSGKHDSGATGCRAAARPLGLRAALYRARGTGARRACLGQQPPAARLEAGCPVGPRRAPDGLWRAWRVSAAGPRWTGSGLRARPS
jgi:hypothetical protein